MTKVKYTTRSGKQQFRPVFNKAFERACIDEYIGFCLACGKTQDGCEPDARKYECEHCEQPKVYGLQELVLMGLAR